MNQERGHISFIRGSTIQQMGIGITTSTKHPGGVLHETKNHHFSGVINRKMPNHGIQGPDSTKTLAPTNPDLKSVVSEKKPHFPEFPDFNENAPEGRSSNSEPFKPDNSSPSEVKPDSFDSERGTARFNEKESSEDNEHDTESFKPDISRFNVNPDSFDSKRLSSLPNEDESSEDDKHDNEPFKPDSLDSNRESSLFNENESSEDDNESKPDTSSHSEDQPDSDAKPGFTSLFNEDTSSESDTRPSGNNPFKPNIPSFGRNPNVPANLYPKPATEQVNVNTAFQYEQTGINTFRPNIPSSHFNPNVPANLYPKPATEQINVNTAYQYEQTGINLPKQETFHESKFKSTYSSNINPALPFDSKPSSLSGNRNPSRIAFQTVHKSSTTWNKVASKDGSQFNEPLALRPLPPPAPLVPGPLPLLYNGPGPMMVLQEFPHVAEDGMLLVKKK
ncbi:hypothetical protein CEXT_119101 [Caerostris extrusa]|uniref:Uncharacterized protein n=1 Tax=Caerostris extrusa TaxID=172846 RepID=A0AAV4QNH6_CAEEX|nr:hypothetical protein CEXT_119101 [Caerostris extrusa]